MTPATEKPTPFAPPAGYKQTDAGIIPEDWDMADLPKVCWFQEGPGLRQWQFTKEGIKVINVTNLENGLLNLDRTDRYIKLEEFNRTYKHFEIDENDIVVASSGNSYGKVAVVRTQDLPLLMNTSVIRFKPLSNLAYDFLLCFLNSYLFKNQLDLLITGGAQPNFGPAHLKKVLIPFPPLPEQQAIAAVLSDADALITALDQLIAKKRNLKQGAMQLLLTGKKRLPGFSGAWETKTLESVCLKNGLVRGPFGGAIKKDFFVKEGIKVYEQRNAIYRNAELGNYYIDKSKYDELKRFEIIEGDFIVSCSGTIGKIYQIPKDARQGVINQALLKIKTDTLAIYDKFFFYYFDWDKFQEKIIDNTQGGAMQNLVGMDIFRQTEINIPSTIEEQKAVARILSEMDAEIAALERQREKYQAVKQGMMQELLTGKTRLV